MASDTSERGDDTNAPVPREPVLVLCLGTLRTAHAHAHGARYFGTCKGRYYLDISLGTCTCTLEYRVMSTARPRDRRDARTQTKAAPLARARIAA